jgi:hypothetical protein
VNIGHKAEDAPRNKRLVTESFNLFLDFSSRESV